MYIETLVFLGETIHHTENRKNENNIFFQLL